MARRQNFARLRSAAETTYNLTDKAACSAFKWAVTDHHGSAIAIERASRLGFVNGLEFLAGHLLLIVLSAVLQAAWIVFLIGFGIPYLITGHF